MRISAKSHFSHIAWIWLPCRQSMLTNLYGILNDVDNIMIPSAKRSTFSYLLILWNCSTRWEKHKERFFETHFHCCEHTQRHNWKKTRITTPLGRHVNFQFRITLIVIKHYTWPLLLSLQQLDVNLVRVTQESDSLSECKNEVTIQYSCPPYLIHLWSWLLSWVWNIE